jgi:hypothetical protein
VAEVDVVCASAPLKPNDFMKSLEDEKLLVVDVLVGDLQRVIECPKLGLRGTFTTLTPCSAALARFWHAGRRSPRDSN